MVSVEHPSDDHAWQRWLSPAKLNLGLRILGRRDDGYHELQTLFQLLDWGDLLWLRRRDDGGIIRHSNLAGVPPEQDLAVRAAQALQSRCGVAAGVDLHIDKQIPLGGGLGGGSSNAGTVLRALNTLWGLDLPATELARIGLSLGADVPLFALGHSALGEGIGERLTPLALPPRTYLVVNPGVEVPTAAVFQSKDLTRNGSPSTIPGLYAETDWLNDCEPVVRRLAPDVARLLDWLRAGGSGHLTGTGATAFAVVPDRAEGLRRLASLPPAWRGWVATGINVAPQGAVDRFTVGTSPSW